jgi:TPR repeat protein
MCFEGININYVSSKNIINDLKRDDPKLETLLERARSDDGDALFAGSLVLLGGCDLAPIDEVEATEWTRRGAVAKHPACSVAYGLHLRSGYAPGRAREADRYVVAGKKWLLDATKDQSQPCALMLRAVVEEVGLGGFRRSKLNAARLCAAAAELGDPFGQFRLGQQHEEQSRRSERDSDQNADAAFRLMRLSAEQGLAAAQRALSIYFQNGFGTEKDPDAAITWLLKAANQHHPIAALEIGYWYRAQREEVEPNSEEANQFLAEMLNWYRVAARSGLPMAELAIAYCHETGLGVEQNKALAYAMYHALAHRDDRTFLTRLPNKQTMDHVRRRMALLKEEAGSAERDGGRIKMAWGEDEVVLTETPISTQKRAGRR